MAKLTNSSTTGTSFHGQVFSSTVSELKEKLGEPQFSQNDGADKVNFEWECETEEGDVFTIYDWKEYREIDETETIHFHIGSLGAGVSNKALEELKQLLK